ncbi:hypothetical protein H257_03133 [Aphanomyces astaci]|uniref:Uncharacterized protein n=1 Tax=Aphanomyces astaci TaxID=112090 RepID=W4H047_APHAT|nr:hypothetical protein H257_03133 [Aphanomyces astaci]ETV85375.1 hypothetical protein H257_03133 [Aphanomyces astaci]|eukprot:XP_009825393.1 hypothetical protein H257_03133 [Aphanomyces astaci]
MACPHVLKYTKNWPAPMYTMRPPIDMFDGRVNHAEFFQLILPLGMLIGSLVTFNLADRLGRAAMLDLSAIPYVLVALCTLCVLIKHA